MSARLEGRLDRFAAEMRTGCALFRAQIRIFRRDVTLPGGVMIAVATGVLLASKFMRCVIGGERQKGDRCRAS